MALLQQNKAKAAMATDEDDSLEQAYIQASSESTVPKKRTREDIIRELKEKRAQGGGVTATVKEPVLDKGKFKPIGFKPIDGSGESKEKKKTKKVKGEGERRKKKRKVEVVVEDKPKEDTDAVTVRSTQPPPSLLEPEGPEPSEDFDIFAGAGEYEGVDLSDDEDERKEEKEDGQEEETGPSGSLGPGRWFITDEQPEADNSHLASALEQSIPPALEDREASDEEPEPTRLVPLSSSAIPSIKELLALNDEAEASNINKKHKRKNKKKGDGDGSKKLDAEAKVNRDYQRSVMLFYFLNSILTSVICRLKSYTEKQGNPST